MSFVHSWWMILMALVRRTMDMQTKRLMVFPALFPFLGYQASLSVFQSYHAWQREREKAGECKSHSDPSIHRGTYVCVCVCVPWKKIGPIVTLDNVLSSMDR